MGCAVCVVGVLCVWLSGVCVCAVSTFSHLELSYWLTHVSLVKRSRGQLSQGNIQGHQEFRR